MSRGSINSHSCLEIRAKRVVVPSLPYNEEVLEHNLTSFVCRIRQRLWTLPDSRRRQRRPAGSVAANCWHGAARTSCLTHNNLIKSLNRPTMLLFTAPSTRPLTTTAWPARRHPPIEFNLLHDACMWHTTPTVWYRSIMPLWGRTTSRSEGNYYKPAATVLYFATLCY
jgi:hypothetical protein